MALADESSPAFVAGGFQVVSAALRAEPRIRGNFQSGAGMQWGEHDHSLFEGTERFFRPNYIGNLVQNWIPALDGVEQKLRDGARVADIGCGHGASTLLMAQAFPKSTFTGFDYHAPSIETCRRRASAAGIDGRLKFEAADSTSFPGERYDLVTCFDCLHDMADPAGSARQVHRSLASDGTWMVVEPFAGDKPEENHTPVGRVFYAASTLICVPCSLAQHGPAPGAGGGREAQRNHSFRRVRKGSPGDANAV